MTNRCLKISIFSSTISLILFGVLYKNFCPLLYDIPIPTGKYLVGFSKVMYQDTEHLILPPGHESIVIDIFYPRDEKKSEGVNQLFAYQPDMINAIINHKSGKSIIKKIFFKQLLLGVKTYTKQNALLLQSDTAYPIIIFLPGIAGTNLYETYFSELASHGYVVFAIEPPGDIFVTAFGQDKIEGLDQELQKSIDESNRTEIYKYRNKAHEIWLSYIEYALQKIKTLREDQNSMFYHMLNTERLGLLGHSHGGAVVTDFCQKDGRCRAGINMDGWTKTYNSSTSFDTPFLFLLSEDGQMPEMETFLKNNEARLHFDKKIILGAGHLAFCDYILLKQPLLRMFGVVKYTPRTDSNGSRFADKNYVNSIRTMISQHLVEFFNTYLK